MKLVECTSLAVAFQFGMGLKMDRRQDTRVVAGGWFGMNDRLCLGEVGLRFCGRVSGYASSLRFASLA